jgi:hypothetical protein
MAKLVLGLGLITSLAMLAIAIIGAPASGAAGSRGEPLHSATINGCNIQEYALDEGYGISRKVQRSTCDDED